MPGAANGPKVHDYLQEMHEQVLSHYNIMTVGETPHTTAQQAQLYTAADRHELDMVFILTICILTMANMASSRQIDLN